MNFNSHRQLYKVKKSLDGLNKRIREQKRVSKKRKNAKILKRRSTCKVVEDIDVELYTVNLCNSIKDCSDIIKLNELIYTFKKVFTKDLNKSLRVMMESDILVYLLNMLMSNIESVHESVTSVLINVLCGDKHIIDYLIEIGYLKVLLSLLKSSNIKVKLNILWCIGNLSCLSNVYRDLFLNENGLRLLLENVSDLNKLNEFRLLSWTLNTICNDGLKYSLDRYLILNKISKLIMYDDYEIIKNICEVLSNISSFGDISIFNLLESNICARLFEFLSFKDVELLCKVLTILGNLICSNDTDNIKLLLNFDIIGILDNKVDIEDNDVKVIILWILSNLSATNEFFVSEILKSNLIVKSINLINTSVFKVQREAVWLLCNSIYKGCPLIIDTLLNLGCVESLCEILLCDDMNIIELILSAFKKMIECNKEILIILEECDGILKIEKINSTGEIIKLSNWIINEFDLMNDSY